MSQKRVEYPILNPLLITLILVIQNPEVKEKIRKLSFDDPKTILKDFFAFASEPENNKSELSVLDEWRSSFRNNDDQDPLPLRYKFRRKSCCCKWCGGISNFDKEIQNSPFVAYAEYQNMQSEIQKEIARQCQLDLDIFSEKEKMSATYSNLGKVKNQKLQGDDISKGRISSLRGIESPLAKEFVFSQASFHINAQSPKNTNDSFGGFKAFQQSSPKNTKQQQQLPDSIKRRSHTKPKFRIVSPIKEGGGGSGKIRLLNKYHQQNKFSSFSTKNLNNFSDYVTKEGPLLKSNMSFAKNLSPIKASHASLSSQNSTLKLVTTGSKFFQVQKVVTSPTKSQQPRLSPPKLKLSTNFIEIDGESQEKNHSSDIKKICYDTTVSTEFNTLGSFNELKLSKVEERQQSKGQRIVKQTLNSALQEKHQDFMKVYLNKTMTRVNDSSLERLTTSKISKDSMIDITTRIEKKILAQKNIYNNSVIPTPTKKRPRLQAINFSTPTSTKNSQKPLF